METIRSFSFYYISARGFEKFESNEIQTSTISTYAKKISGFQTKDESHKYTRQVFLNSITTSCMK